MVRHTFETGWLFNEATGCFRLERIERNYRDRMHPALIISKSLGVFAEVPHFIPGGA